MRLFILVGLAATLATSACTDETGILVHTTANAEITEPIHELQYLVGLDTGMATELVVDRTPEPAIPMDGRDLRTDAYRLLIRPEKDAPAGAMYAVGVIAFNEDGDQLGFGYLPDPVGFVNGSVTQWDIEIHGFGGDDYTPFPDECIRWMDDGTPMGIGTATDQDCDGYEAGDSPEGDCDDLDPSLNPGAREKCNGYDDNCDGAVDGLEADGVTPVAEVADGTDNNCDGICDGPQLGTHAPLDFDGDAFTSFGRFGVCSDSMGAYDCNDDLKNVNPGAWESCDEYDTNCDGNFDEPVPCFIIAADGGSPDRCLQGERLCPDKGMTDTQCQPLSLDANIVGFGRGCQALQSCAGASEANRLGCLIEQLIPQDQPDNLCRSFHTAARGTCEGDAELIVPAPDGLTNGLPCTFQIFGPSEQQGYVLNLEAVDGAGGKSTIINECSVRLHIEVTDASGSADVVLLFSRENSEAHTMRLHLKNDLAESCPEDNELIECGNWQVP